MISFFERRNRLIDAGLTPVIFRVLRSFGLSLFAILIGTALLLSSQTSLAHPISDLFDWVGVRAVASLSEAGETTSIPDESPGLQTKSAAAIASEPEVEEATAMAASGTCTNTLTNPEFDQGANDWSIVAPLPNEAVFELKTDSKLSGKNYAKIKVNKASGVPRDVQLRHDNLVVQAGRNYRISFMAQAETVRNITVFLESATSPFTGYSTTVIPLTKDPQTFTIDVAVSSTNNLNVRLIFALGAINKDVLIDQVTFTEICEPAGCILGGFGSKVRNQQFDHGTAGWVLSFTKANAATYSISTTNELSGANSAYVEVKNSDGTTYYAKLGQNGHTVEAGKKYLVAFRARAISARNVYVKLHNSTGTQDEYAGQTFNVTTTAKTFFTHLIPTTTNQIDASLTFELGAASGGIWIDDITLTEACNSSSFAENSEICGNGIDDDLDGQIDDADSDCGGCTAITYGFQNAVLESGTALQPGAVYYFSNSVDGIDVRLRIVGFSHPNIIVSSFDIAAESKGGYNLAFQPEIDYGFVNSNNSLNPPGERWVDLSFEFYQSGTMVRQTFNDLSVAAIDIDGDENCQREYIETRDFAGYSVDSPTALTLSGALKAKSSLTQYGGIDETALGHIISINYQLRNAVWIRYGLDYDGSCTKSFNDNRLSSLYFKCYTLPVETLCPTLYVNGTPSVCLGQPVTLRASRGGFSGTCSFQWQRSTDDFTWTNIAGATSLTYTDPNPTADTYYRIGMPCSGNATCGVVSSGSFFVDVLNCGEICDNGVDDDGDGSSDCADPDCNGATIGASSVATAVGVVNFAGALGNPNGDFAQVYEIADSLTVSFANTLPAGSTYNIVWRRRAAPYPAGAAIIRVYESPDNVTWTLNTVKPTVSSQSSFVTTVLTSQVAMRFLRFQQDDGTDDDFDLDAVTFTSNCPAEICNNGIDDDGNGFIDGLDAACCPSTSVVPPAGISIVSFSSQEMVSETAPATRAIDGNAATYWHSQYGGPVAPMPHELVLDLGTTRDVSGMQYLPRQDVSSGRIANYEIYVSNSPTVWGAPVTTGVFANGYSEKTVGFTVSRGRYLRLRILSGASGNAFVSAAEIKVLQCDTRMAEVCTNNVDDDGDGLADCNDPSCPKPNVVTSVSH